MSCLQLIQSALLLEIKDMKYLAVVTDTRIEMEVIAFSRVSFSALGVLLSKLAQTAFESLVNTGRIAFESCFCQSLLEESLILLSKLA